jgi:hypothetical protein
MRDLGREAVWTALNDAGVAIKDIQVAYVAMQWVSSSPNSREQ